AGAAPADTGAPETLPDRLDRSPLLAALLGVPLLLVLVRHLVLVGAASLDLKAIIAGMVGLGLLLHGSPRSYLMAVEDGAGAGGPGSRDPGRDRPRQDDPVRGLRRRGHGHAAALLGPPPPRHRGGARPRHRGLHRDRDGVRGRLDAAGPGPLLMLVLEGLRKRYGANVAVDGLF